VLNNSALLYRSLYRLEGKQADFEMSARLLAEAVELQPADSILSYNAADSLLTAAVLRVAGDRIHPELLQYDAGTGTLIFLYERATEKEVILTQLKADPNFRKATSFYWGALLLAPKDTDIYGWGAGLFGYTNDRQEKFPLNFSLHDWLLLDGLHPEGDAKLREAVAKNAEGKLTLSLDRELQFEGPTALLQKFWAKVFEGDPKGAQDLLPKLEQAGVKMPPMF